MVDKTILCLDGGGMKGISLVMILLEIFRCVEKRSGRKLEPCQVFNVFGGTSTGGLLSMFIGLKRHELSKALYLYMSSDPNFLRPKNNFNIVKNLSKYDDNTATNIYLNFFGRDHIDKYKADDQIPYVIATTLRIDKVPTETYIFKNFSNDSHVKSIENFLVYEMARSTSAAPTFWKAYSRDMDIIYKLYKHGGGSNVTNEKIQLNKKINKYLDRYTGINKIKTEYDEITENTDRNNFQYQCKNAMVLVDGGLGSNNPVLLTLGEMVNLSSDSSMDDINLLLSIGCGTTLTKDSTYYSFFRKINENAEHNELCVNLLEIFVNNLYSIYVEIYYNIKSFVKIISKRDEKAAIERIISQNKYSFDFNLDDITENTSKTTLISKKKFLEYVLSTIINIPLNLSKNIANIVAANTLGLLGKIGIFSMNFEKSSVEIYSDAVSIFKIISFCIKAFYFSCSFVNNTIMQSYVLVTKKIKELTNNNLQSVYQNTMINLEKIISDPNFTLELDRKILNILITDNKKLLINIKDELTNFLNQNVLETLTGGTYDSNICANLLKNKYFRLTPIYPSAIDLAESNPVNLRKMMMYTKEYLTNNSDMIEAIAEKINILINEKNIVKNNVVKFDSFDSAQVFGYNIRNNIKYMKSQIYNILSVTVYDVNSYISKKVLSKSIELYYTIYYEAYYCFLNALINYTGNDIIQNEPNSQYQLIYKTKNAEITRTYSYAQIVRILDGDIKLPDYYDLSKIQIGGLNEEILNAWSYQEKYDSITETIKKIIANYDVDNKPDEHAEILQSIINFALKIDNKNNLCYGCVNKNKNQYCQLINNETSSLSDSNYRWNTCKKINMVLNSLDTKYKNIDSLPKSLYLNLVTMAKQTNIILGTFFSSKYDIIKKNVTMSEKQENGSVILEINGYNNIMHNVKIRISSEDIQTDDPDILSIIDLLEIHHINNNQNMQSIDYSAVIYAYSIMMPRVKKVNIKLYYEEDKHYILPLVGTSVRIPQTQSIASQIPNQTNYKKLLQSTNYLDIHPYYLYNFNGNYVTNKITHKTADFSFRDRYGTSNDYFYEIDLTLKFCIVVTIHMSKLVNFDISYGTFVLEISDIHSGQSEYLVSEMMTRNDNYYIIFTYNKKVNRISMGVSKCKLYYYNTNSSVCFYDSNLKKTLFNFVSY